jgi:hypothetical protein
MRQGCPPLPLLFNIVLELLTRIVKKKKGGTNIEKKEAKLSLFADNIMLLLKDPKHTTRRTLHMIYTFSKVTGYTKISI